MSKKKVLCNWDKKRIEKKLPRLVEMIDNPEFVCRDCARAANGKEYLCKPVRLSGMK
jgi:hypothetical protein